MRGRSLKVRNPVMHEAAHEAAMSVSTPTLSVWGLCCERNTAMADLCFNTAASRVSVRWLGLASLAVDTSNPQTVTM